MKGGHPKQLATGKDLLTEAEKQHPF